MTDVEELRAHLVDRYGIHVQAMLTLDQDVILMRRSDGPNWVARVFPESRPAKEVAGDAEILNWLAGVGAKSASAVADDALQTRRLVDTITQSVSARLSQTSAGPAAP
jgi:hypothetical protein